MKITSWNVNSLRVRLPQVTAWMAEHQPDVLMLQETKVKDDLFPSAELEALGYNVAFYGQPAYNGVALLSRHPLHNVTVGIPGFTDTQARVISATVQGVRCMNIYAPNGNTPASEKFVYKGQWYAALSNWLAGEDASQPLIISGDYNIAPEERDVYDPKKLYGTCCFHPDEHEWFKRLQSWGLHDSFRLHHQEAGRYSWWDYRNYKFRKDAGLRIDHLMVTKPLASRCTAAEIDANQRDNTQPSDHVPVSALFSTP